MPYWCDSINSDFSHTSNTSGTTVVVGTGEHLYYPFLVAEHLEKTGDIVFQSTTRSPILKGDAIERKTRFSAGEGKMHYIYNLPMDRAPLILCESDALEQSNGLAQGKQHDVA